jgi:hypothetical protein
MQSWAFGPPAAPPTPRCIRSAPFPLCSVSGGWELPFDHEGMFVAAGETSQPAPFLRVGALFLLAAAPERAGGGRSLGQLRGWTLPCAVQNHAHTQPLPAVCPPTPAPGAAARAGRRRKGAAAAGAAGAVKGGEAQLMWGAMKKRPFLGSHLLNWGSDGGGLVSPCRATHVHSRAQPGSAHASPTPHPSPPAPSPQSSSTLPPSRPSWSAPRRTSCWACRRCGLHTARSSRRRGASPLGGAAAGPGRGAGGRTPPPNPAPPAPRPHHPPPPTPPHRPQDFIYSYRDGIAAVTARDVAAAAAAALHPARQAAVVVADAAQAGPALRGAGFEVRPLQLQD